MAVAKKNEAQVKDDPKQAEKPTKIVTIHGYREGTQAAAISDKVEQMGKGWSSDVAKALGLSMARVNGHIVKDPFGLRKRGLVTVTEQRKIDGSRQGDYLFETVKLSETQAESIRQSATLPVMEEKKAGK